MAWMTWGAGSGPSKPLACPEAGGGGSIRMEGRRPGRLAAGPGPPPASGHGRARHGVHSGVDGVARRGEGGWGDRSERSLHAGLPRSPQLPAVDGTPGAARCDAASRRPQRTALDAVKRWTVETKMPDRPNCHERGPDGRTIAKRSRGNVSTLQHFNVSVGWLTGC